jgi:hypothetical protein
MILKNKIFFQTSFGPGSTTTFCSLHHKNSKIQPFKPPLALLKEGGGGGEGKP